VVCILWYINDKKYNMNLDEFFEVGDYDKIEIGRKIREDINNKKIDNKNELIKKGLKVIEDIINNSINGEMFSMNYKERIDLERGYDVLKIEYKK
jgi:hypothetical protein